MSIIGDIGGFLAEGEAGEASAAGYVPWGRELLLDLAGCDLNTITSEPALREFAAGLVDVIGMQAYGEPILHRFALHDPRAGGYTLLQLITTSLISAHFGEGDRVAFINVCSCQWFDADKATAYITKFFNATVTSTRVVNRG